MASRTAEPDLVISDVTLVDGTGASPTMADVSVAGDRVVDIAPAGTAPAARRRVDARSLTLAPGFIDVHTHDDWALLDDPALAFKTRQGVTTVVTGNCGTAPAPVTDMTPGRESFARMGDYLRRLEAAPPAVNVSALIGHGGVRAAVMGLRTARRAGRDELVAMCELVHQAVEDGVVGMSTGLAYEPGRYASTDEIVELARIIGAAGLLYATHMRDEGDGLLAAVDESILIGEAAGVAVQISHLKAIGPSNWGTTAEALARLRRARARGVDVMADQYPYTRGSTMLEQVVSAGALAGPSPFGHLSGERVLVAAAPTETGWEGRTLAAVAAEAAVGVPEMAERMIATAGRDVIVVLDVMSEDEVRSVMADPLVMTGSDGLPAGSRPHPRLHHTFPRVLGEYVRQVGVFDLATAVHRMTGLSASRFGLRDRGVVRTGAFADLVLFDAETVAGTGTYDQPTTPPIGIHEVWVNGSTVVRDDQVTTARPGRVLRGRHAS